MKIFAFAGSSSSTSINHALVAATLKHFRDCTIEFIPLKELEAPLFSVDLEKEQGHPEAAFRFLKSIEEADALICSLAEHNRSYSAAFKNLFDWASRVNVKVFQNKPMLLMSTSPGGYGGGNVMKEASTFFPQFAADIKATFSLPKFHETFDREQGITDEAQKELHLLAIQTFKASIGLP
ncbi:MAG: NADPH-dependent FMN reductase [Bacteroidetes bacterium 43-16]|nr:MAG: NADPH-dependent FMN reductase [Bacteroidetes bacterium 43-16]